MIKTLDFGLSFYNLNKLFGIMINYIRHIAKQNF